MKRSLCLILALILASLSAAAFAEQTETTEPSATKASSFTPTPIVWDGVGLGKCGLPEGYTLSTEVHCADDYTCLGAPIRVSVNAISESVPALLGFYSSEMFIERVKSAFFTHTDGTRDSELNIFMLKYRDAAGFCDLVASTIMPEAKYYRDEDISFYNSRIEAHLKEYRDELTPGAQALGIKVNWVDVNAAQRIYTFEDEGTPYVLCVMAEVRAYQWDAAGDVSTIWEVPEYYYMVCPLSEYELIHDTDFKVFTENTAVSDAFIKLQEDLTNAISQQIMQGWAAAIQASNAYVRAMNALTTQSVNDYLSSSSYSAADRFSDYIFDRNEYTTSDGYSVSISTSYDYVWEDNGSVYYSNSAFDVPTNATMLTPVR